MRTVRVVGLALAAVMASGCAWVGRVGVASTGAQPASGTTIGNDVSADGRYVVFTSTASNIVAGDTNNSGDVFWRDNLTGVTERVSISSSGVQGDDRSFAASISDNGRYVAFTSDATNLASGDTNDVSDVFVRDRISLLTSRVSVRTNGAQGDDASWLDHISSTGQFVVFSSDASTLVGDDENLSTDVFIRDRLAAATERMSVTSMEIEGDWESWGGSISDNGRYVVFVSDSDFDVEDSGLLTDIYLRDRGAGVTTRVTTSAGSGEADSDSDRAVISGDGTVVAFETDASNLVDPADDFRTDVYTTVRGSGVFERITVPMGAENTDADSSVRGVSNDGRFVLFQSAAKNVISSSLTASSNTFVHDRVTHATVLAGTTQDMREPTGGSPALGGSSPDAISGDGRYLLFTSTATDVLVAGDANGNLADVFLRSNPVPFILFASPATIARGTSGTISLHGAALRATGALVLMGDGVTVTGVTGVGENRLDVGVTVAADAATGPRTPFVVQAGTGAGAYTGGVVFLPGAFAVT